MQQRKRRKRKLRKRGYVVLALMGVMMFWGACRLVGAVSGILWDAGVISAETIGSSKYEIGAPQVLNESQVAKKLYALSQKYPEMKSVYEKREKYPKKLLAALCNNPDMIDFVKGYLSSGSKVSDHLTAKECAGGVPLLIQWDKRWGYASYGDNNIALSGCAPTCLSMVIVGLTGNRKATPYQVARFAEENGYYVEGTGTAWSIMTEGAASYGIRGKEIPLSESKVVSELESGHPIICSMKVGDFTTTGHFIVLTGTKDGKIKVNDPNSPARSCLWNYGTLEGQIRNLWAFCKG